MANIVSTIRERMSFTRSMTLQGLAAAVLAPVGAAALIGFLFLGAIAFSVSYQLLTWLDWLAWVPELSWWQSFLLGGLLLSLTGYLRNGSILTTPVVTMLFAGGVHSDVFPQVPAFGYWTALALYVPFIFVRLIYADGSDD